MLKQKNILTFLVLSLIFNISAAKKEKTDEVVEVQKLLSKAYELGYVNAAPVEISFIEKKIISAKEARENRKKKDFARLISEIRADLKIVKKRYEVTQLQKKLAQLQQDNMQLRKTLDDLKGQLK